MAKREYETKAEFVQVDPSTLTQRQQGLYIEYKASYARMKDSRGAFEEAMQTGVPAGKRMVMGYNYGKLSVAIVDDTKSTAKPASKTLSLAEYMAQHV